jgi:intein/homing endonuclease
MPTTDLFQPAEIAQDLPLGLRSLGLHILNLDSRRRGRTWNSVYGCGCHIERSTKGTLEQIGKLKVARAYGAVEGVEGYPVAEKTL